LGGYGKKAFHKPPQALARKRYRKPKKDKIVKKLVSVFVILFCILILIIVFVFSIGKTKIDFKNKKPKNLIESQFYKNYYNTNDLILINVWATWCEPCLKELPEIKEFSKLYKTKNLKVITLSIDEDTTKLKSFLLKNNEYNANDITMQNLDFRDSIYIKIKLVEPYLNNSIFKVNSKQIPYLVLVKNKKILYENKGVLNKVELKKIIDKNITN
jgi:thiol-disulfide isomerase/thioredoxin